MNPAKARPYEPTPDGARLRVRLTPRGGRNSLDCLVRLADGRWAAQVRVAAPPVDGAANDALIGWLARDLGLPRSRLRLAAGQASRIKTIDLAGDTREVVESLDAWLARAEPKP